MIVDPAQTEEVVSSDAADHIHEARRRAREVFGSEPHLGEVDDWRLALASARDAMTLVWIVWLGLLGFGDPPFAHWLLVAIAIAIALMIGISTGRSTHTKVQYCASELDRERAEIRDHFEQEKEEVRVLYAAKGFGGSLLRQVVDTLAADDDRLLKVMMEEELGLSMHHMNHPLVVGLLNFGGAVVAGVGLALPAVWMSPDIAHVWMVAGGCVFMAIISLLTARSSGRSAVGLFATGIVTAVVTGGVGYWLSSWFAGFGAVSS